MRTAEKLGDYADALKKWKQHKRQNERLAELNKPIRKPLGKIPTPELFQLDPNDGWAKKVYHQIIGRHIPQRKNP